VASPVAVPVRIGQEAHAREFDELSPAMHVQGELVAPGDDRVNRTRRVDPGVGDEPVGRADVMCEWDLGAQARLDRGAGRLEITEIAEVLAFPIDGDRDIQFGRGHGDIGASMENHRG
jgi:hypothetical protein